MVWTVVATVFSVWHFPPLSFRDFLSGGTLRLHSPACLLGHSRGGRRALLCSADRRVDYRCSSFCSLVLPVLISSCSFSLPYDSCRCVFHHNSRFVFSFPQPALFLGAKNCGFLRDLSIFWPPEPRGFLTSSFTFPPVFLYTRRSRPVLLDSRSPPSVSWGVPGTFRDPLAPFSTVLHGPTDTIPSPRPRSRWVVLPPPRVPSAFWKAG